MEDVVCIYCNNPIIGEELYGDPEAPACYACYFGNINDARFDTMYGYFPGGDPRDFTPDYELCSEEEIATWKADCEAWNRGEGTPAPGPHIPITDQHGNEIGHVTAPRYGIGIYTYRD